MRDLKLLDAFRQPNIELGIYGVIGGSTEGVFMVRSPTDGGILRVVASAGEGWDHVSVSRATRTPNWPEMEAVKRMFFKDDECAMQLHVPVAEHLNCHDYCLHLWRPHNAEIPRPPAIFVAPPSSRKVPT